MSAPMEVWKSFLTYPDTVIDRFCLTSHRGFPSAKSEVILTFYLLTLVRIYGGSLP